jgi:hypothetical protein
MAFCPLARFAVASRRVDGGIVKLALEVRIRSRFLFIGKFVSSAARFHGARIGAAGRCFSQAGAIEKVRFRWRMVDLCVFAAASPQILPLKLRHFWTLALGQRCWGRGWSWGWGDGQGWVNYLPGILSIHPIDIEKKIKSSFKFGKNKVRL